MVVDCGVLFPLTEREQVIALGLEQQIDLLLRAAARGEREPVFQHPSLTNVRMSDYLVKRYAYRGWVVGYPAVPPSGRRGDKLAFRPSLKYLAIDVAAVIAARWEYGDTHDLLFGRP